MKVIPLLAKTLLMLACATVVPLTNGQANVRQKQTKISSSVKASTTNRKHVGYRNLISQFRAQGATVKSSNERVSQPFFSVKGRILMINQQAVQVFEFASVTMAETESRRVGEGATTSAAWIAPPHFYHRGRLIVLYVGDNQSILKLLKAVLGLPFAGQ